jgi:hypothetical protein
MSWLETLPNRSPDMDTFLQSIPEPRRLTSHLPLLGRETGKGRIIYVARNPKDVAASHYQHDRSKFGYQAPWDKHFTMFLQGKLLFGSDFDHTTPNAWPAVGCRLSLGMASVLKDVAFREDDSRVRMNPFQRPSIANSTVWHYTN